MKKIISDFLKGLKTSQIVALYNLANPGAQIKKFTNRSVAENRMTAVMEVNPDYFYKRLAATASKLGILLPVPAGVVPITVKPVAKADPPKADPPKATAPAAVKKQITQPHLNLRCGTCGYYAKTTAVWLAKGRLMCPVDPKHGRLLTADERGEKRGR